MMAMASPVPCIFGYGLGISGRLAVCVSSQLFKQSGSGAVRDFE